MPSLIIGFEINCEQYLTVFSCKAETACNTYSKEDLSRQVGGAICVLTHSKNWAQKCLF